MVTVRSAFLLLAVFVTPSIQDSSVFNDCSCSPVVTYSASTAAYCATTVYTYCNSSDLYESSCVITCPKPRAVLSYRNATALWVSTSSISCVGGEFRNGANAKITNLMRPTCGYKTACDQCPQVQETESCPTNYTCNAANFVASVDPDDDCNRISCTNGAILTVYDQNKVPTMINAAAKLFCTVNKKWYNYSNDGSITGGSPILGLGENFSANCALPATCESCRDPSLVSSYSQLPTDFRTGYNLVAPVVTKVAGLCSTISCPNAYTLYGFNGNATGQTGLNYTNLGFLKCSATGLWANGGYGPTPASMQSACLQKILPCPAPDLVQSGSYTQACNATTKINSITCASGLKLSMRYSAIASTTKYDRATFFPGKGWLAHGCDAIASLYTTAQGLAITAYCS